MDLLSYTKAEIGLCISDLLAKTQLKNHYYKASIALEPFEKVIQGEAFKATVIYSFALIQRDYKNRVRSLFYL